MPPKLPACCAQAKTCCPFCKSSAICQTCHPAKVRQQWLHLPASGMSALLCHHVGSCLTLPFLLQYAAQAEDPYFKEALYSTLVDLKATQQLLKMDSPGLLTYLRDAGGLPEGDATRRGAPVGPLSHRQVPTLLTHPPVAPATAITSHMTHVSHAPCLPYSGLLVQRKTVLTALDALLDGALTGESRGIIGRLPLNMAVV